MCFSRQVVSHGSGLSRQVLLYVLHCFSYCRTWAWLPTKSPWELSSGSTLNFISLYEDKFKLWEWVSQARVVCLRTVLFYVDFNKVERWHIVYILPVYDTLISALKVLSQRPKRTVATQYLAMLSCWWMLYCRKFVSTRPFCYTYVWQWKKSWKCWGKSDVSCSDLYR